MSTIASPLYKVTPGKAPKVPKIKPVFGVPTNEKKKPTNFTQNLMKTSDEITKKVLEKLAAISSEDIASALAGRGRKRKELSPEEIEEFAKELGKVEALKQLKIGLPLGGGVGGVVGAGVGAGVRGGKGALIGALIGLLTGGGLGSLAYFGGKRVGERGGEFLGEAIRAGKLPTALPPNLAASFFYPQAIGFQSGLEQDLSPEEYKEMRSKLRSKIMRPVAALGGMAGVLPGLPGISKAPLAPLVGGAVGAGSGALLGLFGGSREASKLLDLYNRGYGHLADRIKARILERGFFG